jgi:peptidoglycan hydrolase CwlO-like protein
MGRGLFFFLTLIFLATLFLASITVYNFFDTPSPRSTGNDLVSRDSSSVREQQLNKIIELNQQKLNQLQDENNRRKQDVTDLEARVQELTKSIESLKQLAKEVEAKVPGGAAPGPLPSTTPGG